MKIMTCKAMFSKKIYYTFSALCLCIMADLGVVYSKSLSNLTPQVIVQKSDQVVRIKGEKVYVHSVRPGQTLYSISRAYNISQQLIEEHNPQIKDGGLKAHANIFIPFIESKTINNAESNDLNPRMYSSDSEPMAKDVEKTDLKAKDESEYNIFGRKRKKNKKSKKTDADNSSRESDDYGSKTIEGMPMHDNQSNEINSSSNGVAGVVVCPDPEVGSEETLENEIVDPKLSEFDRKNIDVALLLPLYEQGVEARGNNNFVDFYQGFCLAADKLSKKQSVVTNIKVFSTSDMTKIDTSDLEGIDLIVGPVYERDARSIVEYSKKNRIAMVSPLSDFVQLSSPYMFQVAPIKQRKYDKVKSLLGRSRVNSNIVMLMPSSDIDNELVQIVDECKDVNIKRVAYNNNIDIEQLEASLQSSSENIIIVPMTKESQVEQVLSRLVSLNTMGRYRFKVIGSSVWSRFNNLNLDLLYKLSAGYVSSYHADRTSAVVRKFQSDYIRMYGSLPTLFSMRGYDVGMMFIGSLNKYGSQFPLLVDSQDVDDLKPLDVTYDFYRSDYQNSDKVVGDANNHMKTNEMGNFVNHEWVFVNYTPNYSIELK